MTCGIYKISFEGTDSVYIGLSKNIEQRIRGHKHASIHGKEPEKLQQAFNKYPKYYIEILCECDPGDLDKYEKEAIEIYNSIDSGFNTRNGGTTGGTPGEVNGRSKYSNEDIEKAFKLLLDTELTHKEISGLCNISREAVTHISAQTGHRWLKEKYPEQYLALELKQYSRKISPVDIINMETREVITVNTINYLQELTGAAYTTVTNFLSGRNKTLLHKWAHVTPKSIPKKKPVYTMVHTGFGTEITFSSKLKFFTENNLVNRRKFSEFLSTGNLGCVYQNWQLTSISA